MRYIDVFNGDADGLCALIQLRHAQPQQAQLITGVKRDINLLSQVAGRLGDQITVLDIAFENNAKDVERLLNKGAFIDYIDHHKTGELIKHDNLQIAIDLSANTCTSLIIDQRLQGQYRAWALTAAYGDNLAEVATSLGLESGFCEAELLTLKELGILLNYNSYGSGTDDLLFHPAELFEQLIAFATPFEFLDQDQAVFEILANGYKQDMAKASTADIIHQTAHTAIIQLPDKKWARRVSGAFSNELANESPDIAHAVLTKKDNGTYLASVRSPLNRKFGADELASQFSSGGGRKSAAGINQLPAAMLSQFIEAFDEIFSP